MFVIVSRSPASSNFTVSSKERSSIPYLVRLGWAGDTSAVASSIDRYCMPDQTGGLLYVELPVTGMFNAETAGLGVVFGQQHLRIGSDRDPRRAALLEALVRAGLCTASEKAALLKWPGKELVPLTEQRPGSPDAAWVHCWHDIKIVHSQASTDGESLSRLAAQTRSRRTVGQRELAHAALLALVVDTQNSSFPRTRTRVCALGLNLLACGRATA